MSNKEQFQKSISDFWKKALGTNWKKILEFSPRVLDFLIAVNPIILIITGACLSYVVSVFFAKGSFTTVNFRVWNFLILSLCWYVLIVSLSLYVKKVETDERKELRNENNKLKSLVDPLMKNESILKTRIENQKNESIVILEVMLFDLAEKLSYVGSDYAISFYKCWERTDKNIQFEWKACYSGIQEHRIKLKDNLLFSPKNIFEKAFREGELYDSISENYFTNKKGYYKHFEKYGMTEEDVEKFNLHSQSFYLKCINGSGRLKQRHDHVMGLLVFECMNENGLSQSEITANINYLEEIFHEWLELTLILKGKESFEYAAM